MPAAPKKDSVFLERPQRAPHSRTPPAESKC